MISYYHSHRFQIFVTIIASLWRGVLIKIAYLQIEKPWLDVNVVGAGTLRRVVDGWENFSQILPTNSIRRVVSCIRIPLFL